MNRPTIAERDTLLTISSACKEQVLHGKSMAHRPNDRVEQIVKSRQPSVPQEIQNQIEAFFKDYTKA